MAQPFNNILVYRCGTIGDTIVALPTLAALRKAFPGAKLSLMTATGEGLIWTDEVLEGFAIFDNVLRYRSTDLRRAFPLFNLFRKVRSVHADLIVYLAGDRNCRMRIWRDRFFFRLAGIPYFRYSASSKVRTWGPFIRKNRTYPYEVDRLFAAVTDLGSERSQLDFRLPLDDGHNLKADRILQDAFGEAGLKVVGFCPGSKMSAKQWPAERFADVGERLIRLGGVNIVFVGGKDEWTLGHAIAARWPAGRWLNLAGRLSVLESAALLKRCTFYVGNDTGAMHLAAAVGTRCLAIFGARAHEQSWHPYGPNHVVIRKRVPCANCYLADCVEHNLRCLTEISADEVWMNCERMLTFD